MSESSSAQPEGGWVMKPPFSQRPRVQMNVSDPPVPADPPRPSSPSISPIPAEPAVELTASSAQTQPIEIETLPLPVSSPSAFRLLKPEEVTPEERRQIEIQMTAYYWAQKLLTEENYVAPPDEYSENRSVWRMLFQEMIPAGVVLILLSIVITSVVMGWFSWLLILIFLIGVVICGAAGVLIHFLWRITFIVCNKQNTGIARREVRWLLLSELVPELQTASINVKEPTKSHLAVAIKLNLWRVKLETPAQDEDPKSVRLGFVRDGDLLVQTISDFQSYIQSRR